MRIRMLFDGLQAPFARAFRLRVPPPKTSFLFFFSAQAALVAVFLLLLQPAVQSQQPSSPAPTQLKTSTAAPASSTIFITAKGEGATVELSPADLALKLDGKSATVEEVHRLVGTAPYYSLLVDTSGSRRENFKLEQYEATELLSKVVHPGRDLGMLISFSDEAFIDAEGTDPSQLVKAIAKELRRGATALYDAVVSSANRMSEPTSGPSLRLMFLLSDGDDNFSHVNKDAAVLALLKAGIRVYAIGSRTVDPRVRSPYTTEAASILEQFAGITGGTAYFPANQKDADAALTDIAAQLNNVFAVTYTLPDQKSDSRLHKLEMKCSKKGISIRAPTRLYAPHP